MSNDTAVTLPTGDAFAISQAPALTPRVQEADLVLPLVNRAAIDGFAAPSPSTRVAGRLPVPFEPIKTRTTISDPGTAVGDAAKRTSLATGAGARKFGTSIARFLTRGGKTVASSF
jgi:hypothetical protein